MYIVSILFRIFFFMFPRPQQFPSPYLPFPYPTRFRSLHNNRPGSSFANQLFPTESSIETSMDSGLEHSRVAASASTISLLDDVIEEARRDLESRQQADGHWVFELEADATIPSEYILLEHFLDEIDIEIERKLAVYLRGIQGRHGGWPPFPGGHFHINASLQASYALTLIGANAAPTPPNT